MDFVDALIKIPSRLVESNIRVLYTSLLQGTERSAAWQADSSESESSRVLSNGTAQAAQSSNKVYKKMEKEDKSRHVKDSKSYPTQSSHAKDFDKFEDLSLDDLKPSSVPFPELLISEDRKWSGPANLRESSAKAGKRKAKPVTSHRERFFLLKADISRQDVVDQEVRLLQSRLEYRKQPAPRDIVMISGLGRYPRPVQGN